MSKEIRFRAWLLKENKMAFVDSLHHNKGYGGALEIFVDNPDFDPLKANWEGENRPHDNYLNHSMSVHKDRNGGDDFILMQYTGLTDISGKEIYDGDILSHHNSNFFDWLVEIIEGHTCLINIGVDGYRHEPMMLMKESASQREVIGNRYENHELVKKQS